MDTDAKRHLGVLLAFIEGLIEEFDIDAEETMLTVTVHGPGEPREVAKKSLRAVIDRMKSGLVVQDT